MLRGAQSKVTGLPSHTFTHSRSPQEEKVGRLSFPHQTHSEEWEPVSSSAVSPKLTGTHHPTAAESQMSFPQATSWRDYASHSLSSNTEYIKNFHFCCWQPFCKGFPPLNHVPLSKDYFPAHMNKPRKPNVSYRVNILQLPHTILLCTCCSNVLISSNPLSFSNI